MVLIEIKSQKTLFPSGFKGQKNIFYDFPLLRSMSKKHSLGRDEKAKNIVSFGVQRSKEHGPGWNQK